MIINRKVEQTKTSAKQRVKFCLDQLEKANGFGDGLRWTTEIIPIVRESGMILEPGLLLEDLIGALVSVEQEMMIEGGG